MLVYMFAVRESTKEMFEILSIEMYQGEVMHLELLDSNGMTHQLDQPEGFIYKFKTEEGDGYNN